MGSIKVIEEGLELANVLQPADKAIAAFLEMKGEAERAGDSFYVLQELYSHRFSYGLYLDIVKLREGSLKQFDLKQSTLQLLFNSCFMKPRFKDLIGEKAFLTTKLPQTIGGLRINPLPRNYIYDSYTWREWRYQWFSTHQADIDWRDAVNDYFPNAMETLKILRRELESLGEEVYKVSSNKIVESFYNSRMYARMPCSEKEAYIEKVGKEICIANYYFHEEELEKREMKENGGKKRIIYSIINRCEKKSYVSFDFAHGHFEVLDQHGKHLGDMAFGEKELGEAKADHSFVSIK